MTPPVLVLSRDRLNTLRQVVDTLAQRWDPRIVIVDADSSYPPLLDYLAGSDHEIVRLGCNPGHAAIWDLGVVDALGIDGRYVVTDPDVVPDAECPDDLFDHLAALLDRYDDVAKVGLGLRTDDLPPEYGHRDAVIAWEAPFRTRPREAGVYDAPVDTTFALYRAECRNHLIEPALRTDTPYVARHLTWYLDTADLPADERYYRRHAAPAIANWVHDELPEWLEDGSGHPFGTDAVAAASATGGQR